MCQWETGGMFRFQRGGVALAPQAPKTNSLRTQEGHALVSTMNASQQIDKKMEQRGHLKVLNVISPKYQPAWTYLVILAVKLENNNFSETILIFFLPQSG